MQVGRGDHGGPGVVAGGEVGADGGDHHVGASGGPGGEGGVEDVRSDEDLGLGGGRGWRCGAVASPDLVAALGGEGDDVGADAAGGSEDGDVHGQVLLFVKARAKPGAGWLAAVVCGRVAAGRGSAW